MINSLNKNKITGFTLIELLVVISIIGILVAFVSFNFTGTLKSTRDTQRKNDLKTYQTGVESMANKNNGYYPYRTGSGGAGAVLNGTNICGDFGMTSPCPSDPINSGVYVYRYETEFNSGGTGGQFIASNYTLWVTLEDNNNYWVVCSNGKSFETTSNPASFNGVCP